VDDLPSYRVRHACQLNAEGILSKNIDGLLLRPVPCLDQGCAIPPPRIIDFSQNGELSTPTGTNSPAVVQ
jgi:hypothetical protein